ncbi:hypothetical protein B484DRAFT_446682 [Ochromonadaceae sp. CCMP2298]|nr:hypothetical protein B484DRAFT_446682 [Ochromonadaceae sp. CCMP2298]
MARVQHCDGAEQSAAGAGYSKMDGEEHPERINLLRTVLLSALTVTAALYGVAVYYGLSDAEQAMAGKEFELLARQAGKDIGQSLTRSNDVLNFLAERYATFAPDQADWPLVQLPGFVKDMPYLRDTIGFETLFFAPIVSFEDANKTEAYLMDAWAADPLIPADAGLLPLPGIYGINATAGYAPYQPTTRVTWDAQYEVIAPVSQMLFCGSISATSLGRDIHAEPANGAALEEVIRCTESSDYSHARINCGRFTMNIAISEALDNVLVSNVVVPIMLNSNSAQMVGVVGAQFHWAKHVNEPFPESTSGIDMVLRYEGDVFTFHVDKGTTLLKSLGDTHGSRYKKFKYVVSDIVISGTDTFTLEFYPQQDFMDDRQTVWPALYATCAALLILLCAFIFMAYDFSMRGKANRTTIVLDTKRRFVRFISHEIRTPLNTVNMGLTLFNLELDTIRDVVMQMVGQVHVHEQSGTTLEVVQNFLLGKIDELRSIVKDVTVSTDAAVDTLNDMLNYDKMESGIFVLEFAFVTVGEVLQRSMAAFLLLARDKNIALSRVTEDDADGVEGAVSKKVVDGLDELESGKPPGLDPRYQLIGDASRLGQVLRNLLSNAMKFTNSGGTVTVTVQRVPGGMPGQVCIALPEEQRGLLSYPRAGSVCISVVDTGAGLSEQQLLDVGKEGLQFNANALQGGGGSGLGLFISKGLVQQHGGQMTVTSPGLGRGASIALEFPLFDTFDAESLSERFGSAFQPDIEQPDIDDSPSFQTLMPGAMEGANLSVKTRNGTGADVGPGLGGLGGMGIVRRDGAANVPWPRTIPSPLTTITSPTITPVEMETPHLTPPHQTPQRSPSRANSCSVCSYSGPPRHMLVVDDAVSNRKLLMRIFRIKGFTCEEACDGQEALHKYGAMVEMGTPPEAILMDYEMPVMNGPTSTKNLREMGCSCFIIGVTGNVMQADMDFFKSCGADAVFAKPLSTESVEKLMARISSVPPMARNSSPERRSSYTRAASPARQAGFPDPTTPLSLRRSSV